METKPWWQSRTIWTGLVGGIFALLSIFGYLPEGLKSDFVVETILGITSVGAIIFRSFATKKVVLTTTPV